LPPVPRLSSSSATSLGQPVEGVVVVEAARDEAEALGEATPDLLRKGVRACALTAS
jgi:hypothetical protein